jgi:hypothetical protein
LLELLNKVWDLANLIEVRFSRGYAKTVAQSYFQRDFLVYGSALLGCVSSVSERLNDEFD